MVAQLLGPLAVLSHAAGIGTIWLRSLYRSQLGEYDLLIVIWISVGLTTLMLVMFAGKPV